MKYTIRAMNREEINLAVDWAATEGWNPGLHDAGSFYAADPGGFLIGELNGEPVAVISVIKYGSSFGFLGFYIVKPEYRGQGYGIKIWDIGLKRLAERNIGLDGVVAQQDNYKKSGFKLAYRNMRFEGISGGTMPNETGIINLSQVPFEVVESYDRPFFPEERTQFLKSWLTQPESIALGMMSDGKLSGYGVVRPCRIGYKIGPLFADTPEIADTLFNALNASVNPGQPIFLDVPETNNAAVTLAHNYNMKLSFETARMYTGNFPDLPIERLFGVTTFELG